MSVASKKKVAGKPRPPARPKHLPKGRWLKDFENLSDAEKRLVLACRHGEPWESYQDPGQPPEAATSGNTIRAEFVRFFALGGDLLNPVHEKGVVLRGAWISGTLNLSQCQAATRLDFKWCHFETAPQLTAAHLSELQLTGSIVPGIYADRLIATGSVFLDKGFSAAGTVWLRGAEVRGNLMCGGGEFSEGTGGAINADRIRIRGSIFLKDGFTAKGIVRLVGAEVGGSLHCDGGKFANSRGHALSGERMTVKGSVFLRYGFSAEGKVRLLGAQIGGDLSCKEGRFKCSGGNALQIDRITVKGSLYLTKAVFKGSLSLAAAQIGTLNDDDECWISGKHLLNGLRYERIVGPVDAQSRIAWLKSQRDDHLNRKSWKPQPWEQLIKVLREMGHPGEASEVAMEKQRMMRAAGQIGLRQPNTNIEDSWRQWIDINWNSVTNYLARGFHDFYGWIAGYGYRPSRIVGRMALVWLVCTLSFEAGREFGYFGPSNAIINTSSDLSGCGAPGETSDTGNPKPFWHAISCPMPAEYSTLYPPLYSLDLILPLVDLQQDAEWAPIVVNENGEQLFWGYVLRAIMWFEILFGWFASLMFVAIVSRLVEKD